MIKNRIYILPFLFLLLSGGILKASDDGFSYDSCTSVASKKILMLKTLWSGSSNAASLTFFDCGARIASAYMYSNLSSGDYRLYQQAESNRDIGFYTDGFTQLNRWKFYGKFGYKNVLQKDIKWVDVFDPYDDNPYTLADSVGGNYSKEIFLMEGKGSYHLSDRISFGYDIELIAGVGAKRKDPRPKNTITKFNISPGIILDYEKFSIGANFRYQGSKEDIEVTTVTEETFYLFHFKGLGVYSSTPEFDDRSSESNLLGGGIQLGIEGSKIKNLTEIDFYKKSTDIKRSETFPLQVVLLEKYKTKVNSTFMMSTSNQKINKLKLFYTDKRNYGQEPVVEPKLEAVTYQWSTVAKYTLYWHEETQFGFDYSYYKIIDRHHFDWGANISGKVNNSKTTYYFVPEYNKQNLQYLNLDANLEKGFKFRSGDLVLSCSGGYKKVIDGSLELVEDESLLATVNTEFATHDFDYYNSGLWQVGASAKIGKNISIYQSPMQVFLDAGYKLMISDLPGKPKWNVLEVKLGMNF